MKTSQLHDIIKSWQDDLIFPFGFSYPRSSDGAPSRVIFSPGEFIAGSSMKGIVASHMHIDAYAYIGMGNTCAYEITETMLRHMLACAHAASDRNNPSREQDSAKVVELRSSGPLHRHEFEEFLKQYTMECNNALDWRLELANRIKALEDQIESLSETPNTSAWGQTVGDRLALNEGKIQTINRHLSELAAARDALHKRMDALAESASPSGSHGIDDLLEALIKWDAHLYTDAAFRNDVAVFKSRNGWRFAEPKDTNLQILTAFRRKISDSPDVRHFPDDECNIFVELLSQVLREQKQ